MTHLIAQPDLVSALETCAPICNKRHTNPAFSRVRLSLNHELKFSATDSILTVTGSRALTETGPLKETTVDCAALLQAAQRMGDVVSLRTQENNLEIKSGKRIFKIATVWMESPAPLKRPKKFTTVPARPIFDAMNRVKWAAVETDSRINSVSVAISGQVLTVRGIHGSGHKGAEYRCPIAADAAISVLIPLSLLPSFMQATERSQEIGLCEDDAAFWLDTEPGLFRYLSAADRWFPDHIFDGHALTLEEPVGVDVESKALADAAKYASLAARDGEGVRTRVRVTATDDAVTVSSVFSETGRDTVDSVECKTVGAMKFNTDPAYLAEALLHAGDECSIRQSGVLGPQMNTMDDCNTNTVIFTSEGYLAFVLPQNDT